MKSRLVRARPRAPLRMVRRLELASDNPLLKPETRRRVERVLREVRGILRERAMARWDMMGRPYRISFRRVRRWTSVTCRCGAYGALLVEQNHFRIEGLAETVALKVDHPFALGDSGEIICLRCWARHPVI